MRCGVGSEPRESPAGFSAAWLLAVVGRVCWVLPGSQWACSADRLEPGEPAPRPWEGSGQWRDQGGLSSEFYAQPSSQQWA